MIFKFLAIRIETLIEVYAGSPNFDTLKMTQIDHVKIEEYKQSLENKHCETLSYRSDFHDTLFARYFSFF